MSWQIIFSDADGQQFYSRRALQSPEAAAIYAAALADNPKLYMPSEQLTLDGLYSADESEELCQALFAADPDQRRGSLSIVSQEAIDEHGD